MTRCLDGVRALLGSARRTSAATLLVLNIVLFPGMAAAQTITFTFRGVVDTVSNDPSGTLAGHVTAGSPFQGFYTFMSATPDSEPNSAIGLYQSATPTGLSLTLGTHPTLARFNGLRVRVRNDIGGVEDDYEVILQPAPVGVDEIRLLFRTRDLTRLQSDALPTSPLKVADFSDVHAPVLEVSLPGGVYVGGTVQSLTIASSMSIDRSSLNFAAVSSGDAFLSATGPQSVRLLQSGSEPVSWTASSNQPWLVVSPVSGSGTATLIISTRFVSGLSSTQGGSITLTFTGAPSPPGPITVTLKTIPTGMSLPPFGSFDTPLEGAVGVVGSIAVTGWVLDDVEAPRVRILRDHVPGEPPIRIYIGDAVLVDGARPDVAAIHRDLPHNTRAGWGYMMLTNFLPNGGNGTFTLYAEAVDVDGHAGTLIGSKTITCDNAHSTAPFGAIDTPQQGQPISGTIMNFGWVLSPGTRRADPPGGGIVNVFVDGINVGTPSGWGARGDITSLFPVADYSGAGTAVGGFVLDTTTLTNGVHTISWVVATALGEASGVGSRYFSVSNGSDLVLNPPAVSLRPMALSTLGTPSATLPTGFPSLADAVNAAPADPVSILGRRGFDLESPLAELATADGRITVHAEELDRIELRLSRTSNNDYSGYLITTDGMRPLPIGSALDKETGTFTWGTGPGFVGTYDFAFVRWNGGRAIARQDIRVVLNPQGSNRIGAQVVIDAPAPAAKGEPAVVGRAFFVSGWAIDLDSKTDRGVETVHVWAYPVTTTGRYDDPLSLGAAIFGSARPDVAAIYGSRFEHSGYAMIAKDLAPGTYDIAVFAFSSVRNDFVPAKVVRVTVR